MCLFKSPKAPPPPPPPPTPASKQEEELNERKRLAKRKGFNTLTPFAINEGMLANPTMQKTLLGG